MAGYVPRLLSIGVVYVCVCVCVCVYVCLCAVWVAVFVLVCLSTVCCEFLYTALWVVASEANIGARE